MVSRDKASFSNVLQDNICLFFIFTCMGQVYFVCGQHYDDLDFKRDGLAKVTFPALKYTLHFGFLCKNKTIVRSLLCLLTILFVKKKILGKLKKFVFI